MSNPSILISIVKYQTFYNDHIQILHVYDSMCMSAYKQIMSTCPNIKLNVTHSTILFSLELKDIFPNTDNFH